MALLTVFGNIITSLSWFGVNMLGVGLHSYGFMDRAFGPLIGFIVSQLAIIGLGLIPLKYWRGIRARQRPGWTGSGKVAVVGASGEKLVLVPEIPRLSGERTLQEPRLRFKLGVKRFLIFGSDHRFMPGTITMPIRPHILVVGSSNTDMVVFCDRLPHPGETVLGGQFHMFGGGKGANQAVAAARAGGAVTFLGCLWG